jgi:hypothetical protein
MGINLQNRIEKLERHGGIGPGGVCTDRIAHLAVRIVDEEKAEYGMSQPATPSTCRACGEMQDILTVRILRSAAPTLKSEVTA